MLTRRESKDASKFLDSITAAKQKQQLESKIDDLCRNPLPNDIGKLKGSGDAYVDCGEFRIVYGVADDGCLDVLTVGRRNDGDIYSRHDRKGRKAKKR